MNSSNSVTNSERGTGPGRAGSLIDIVIYVAMAFGFWEIEEALRAADKFPYPGLFDGGMALVLSFFVVTALMKWRGQSWSDFGLKRPTRWWFIPVWGLAVIAANIVAQLTLVPLIALLTNAPSPDFSRYDILTGNLRLTLISAAGAMITGGFIEEFIYRGMMIDRLSRIFGGGRRAVVFAALLNGVPFGLIHFQWGVGGMLLTAVMGSVLGLMYLATKRNLWPLIAGHATLDAILMSQVYLGVISSG